MGAPGLVIEKLRFEVAEGLALASEAAGPTGGARVVLIHGGGQGRGAWRSGMRTLARAGYRVIVPDMRGHGESDWAPDGLYALEHWAADLQMLVRMLAAQGGGPVALVGASRGGQSCLLTAVALPEPVRCVVLIDVTPSTSDAGIDRIRAFLTRSAQGFDRPEDAARLLADFSGARPRGDPASLGRAMRQAPDGRWFWRWDPRMALPDFVRPPSEQVLMEAAARRVTHPVLLVKAGLSELVRSQDVAAFAAVKPDLEVVEVPGIGHMISGDSNDAFMPPVVEFLRRHHPAVPAGGP